MFKPVVGSDLNNFDEATRALYTKRHSDPRLTHQLLSMPRVNRNHFPVIAGPNDPTVRYNKEYVSGFPLKLFAGTAFFIFAANQFSKIYFPYGIVLRRSVPTSWAKYMSHRVPIGIVFLTLWYF